MEQGKIEFCYWPLESHLKKTRESFKINPNSRPDRVKDYRPCVKSAGCDYIGISFTEGYL